MKTLLFIAVQRWSDCSLLIVIIRRKEKMAVLHNLVFSVVGSTELSSKCNCGEDCIVGTKTIGNLR